MLDQVGPLHNVDVQARADVPGDVAVEGPDARIVGVDLHDDVAGHGRRASGQNLHVAALRVVRVGDGAVPVSGAGGQDLEVVAVHVHGVGGDEVVAHDEADGGVLAEVVDVPLWVVWVAGVS